SSARDAAAEGDYAQYTRANRRGHSCGQRYAGGSQEKNRSRRRSDHYDSFSRRSFEAIDRADTVIPVPTYQQTPTCTVVATDSGLTFSIRHLPSSRLLNRKPWFKPALT